MIDKNICYFLGFIRVIPDKLMTFLWTLFYRLFWYFFFDKMGSGCFFESRINLPRSHGKILLADNIRVGRGVEFSVSRGAHLNIECGVTVGLGSVINCKESITIGSNTLIAQYCSIYDNDHCFDNLTLPISDQPYTASPVVIGKNCWLGAKVTILKNSLVGDGVIIGACSLVNSTLPSLVVACGVPAKIVKQRA